MQYLALGKVGISSEAEGITGYREEQCLPESVSQKHWEPLLYNTLFEWEWCFQLPSAVVPTCQSAYSLLDNGVTYWAVAFSFTCLLHGNCRDPAVWYTLRSWLDVPAASNKLYAVYVFKFVLKRGLIDCVKYETPVKLAVKRAYEIWSLRDCEYPG
jgi:hypothetical protein